MGPYFASLLGAYKGFPLASGRLAQVIEGSGKRRIFAICNYMKQRLLRPVHDWAMKVLSTIPMDGTFNQVEPLQRLRSKRKDIVYSFDLKSATDRWPLSVIYTVMCMIWGDVFASSVVNSTLGLNTFLVGKPIVKRLSEVAFTCGQPLGFYGSWSLFALSHHYIVWLAALKAYPNRSSPFTDYALLGDDIVIADEAVACQYSLLLERLGVSISIPKSIISRNGTVEFAKRYWTKSMQVDLSPVSMKAIFGSNSLLGICRLVGSYGIDKLYKLFRLAGAGFRVRARMHSTSTRRWVRMRAIAGKPFRSSDFPLELWLGRLMPLNPYLRSKMITFLRKEFKPKEIRFVRS